MKIRLICSCGLLLESAGRKLLIDAPNAPLAPFYELPQRELSSMIAGEPPYDGPLSLVFTHIHPDHYCSSKVQSILEARGDARAFVPDASTPEHGKIRLGAFTVTFAKFPHTPVPENLLCAHYVLLVEAEGKAVYITADAAVDVTLHRQFLAGRRCDAAFWNGQYLSREPARELLHEAAERNYVYHIPLDDMDVTGIRRKIARNMERFEQELPSVTLLPEYPSEIML